ncbi:uncharacterized protein METZ01_LOCUS215403, partial [marine metagenome]
MITIFYFSQLYNHYAVSGRLPEKVEDLLNS